MAENTVKPSCCPVCGGQLEPDCSRIDIPSIPICGTCHWHPVMPVEEYRTLYERLGRPPRLSQAWPDPEDITPGENLARFLPLPETSDETISQPDIPGHTGRLETIIAERDPQCVVCYLRRGLEDETRFYDERDAIIFASWLTYHSEGIVSHIIKDGVRLPDEDWRKRAKAARAWI